MPPSTTRYWGVRMLKPTLLGVALIGSAAVTTLANTAPAQPTLPAAISFFPLRLLWSAALGAPPGAPPVTDGDSIFVALRTGSVSALTAGAGTPVWSARLEPRGPLATDGGRVFVATDGAIEALDAKTGSAVWRTPTVDGRGVLAVTATAGWVFVIIDSGELRALRAESGLLVWQQTVNSPARAAPVVEGQLLYVGTTNGDISALNLADGTPAWTTRLDGEPAGFGVQ